MREIIAIPVGDVLPPSQAVLRAQGMPLTGPVAPHIERLLGQAMDLLTALVSPVGIWAETTADEFAEVYEGEGENEPETPVAGIFPRASQLVYFAVTLGQPVSDRISELFAERDFALAAMLDAAASEAAERVADALEAAYHRRSAGEGGKTRADRWLRYSPGYCGWHVSGQRALFAALRPEEIGITLRKSCLMEPLKSISGVIVGGPAAIHEFEDSYPFCAACTTHECRDRIRRTLSSEPRES